MHGRARFVGRSRAAAATARRMPAVRPKLILPSAVLLAAALCPAGPSSAATLGPCRLPGLEHEVVCGSVQRPLDPGQPQGRNIAVHYAVLPALARNKKPDPVFFFAGGPGQSAIDIAGTVSRMLARLSNRRDIVLVDQRGTGRSAPLVCDAPEPTRPLRDSADPVQQFEQLRACRARLEALPHGDLRQYTTTIAMQDVDAVRNALGAERINLVGASYGTRAVLEYQRQFPRAVRRAVIDGVAPPDMALPASFSPDAQSALDAVLAACAADKDCERRHPALQARWRALLATLPREITVAHPVTGRDERLVLTRDMAAALVRAPLYAPVLASALPHAIAEAADGRFAALVGIASALQGGRRQGALAMGMHLSVICAEDMPRVAGSSERAGVDFGSSLADLYTKSCADWPRGEVPAAFYGIGPTSAATLVLSGGADPVTPSRHGERVARLLGAKARHVVVPEAGHGLLALPCLRDAVFRFIDAESDEAALAVDAGCARTTPRPPAFEPVAPAAGAPR